MENKNLSDIVETFYLNSDNAKFYLSKNGFLMLNIISENDNLFSGRVFLQRLFPFQLLNEYISVLDKEENEVGIIRNIEDINNDDAELVKNELNKKYFIPKIKKILLIKENFGFSYWKCETDVGDMSFSLQDTFKSIIKITNDRVYILDVNGMRYEIESLEALDKNSFRKIELYL